MLDLGIKKKDKVAYMMYTSPECASVMYACAKIGALFVNVNYRYVSKEIEYILNNSDSVAIFLDDDFLDTVVKARPNLEKVSHFIVLVKNIPSDMHSFNELKNKYPKTSPTFEWEVTKKDPIAIFYTGGTTGIPKGVIFGSDEGLLRAMEPVAYQLVTSGATRRIGEIPPEIINSATKQMLHFSIPGISLLISNPITRFITNRPLFERIIGRALISIIRHPALTDLCLSVSYRILPGRLKMVVPIPFVQGAGGLVANVMLVAIAGATIIIPDMKHFDPKIVLETIEKEKADSLFFIGDAFVKPFVESPHVKDYDTSSLLFMLTGAAACAPHLKRKFHDLFPQTVVVDGYTFTEIGGGGAGFSLPTDKDLTKLKFMVNPNSKLYPTRCINPDTGEDVKPGSGEVGELVFADSVMPGYWKDPVKTAERWRIIEGRRWYFSGDMGTIDSEGYFYFVGRDHCINTGGNKVFPEEVEGKLLEHPKILDVGVVGVPDERWGEAVTAGVVLKEGENITPEEIIEWCRDKMAGFKKPKHAFFIPTDFPRTPAGKLEKKKLKVEAYNFMNIEIPPELEPYAISKE